MKVQIRRGVFETNSSSTHAINIYKGSNYVIPEHIVVRPGEFGWENDYYDDPVSKLSYLYTWCLSRCSSWDKNEITGQYESHYDYKLQKDYQHRIKSNLEALGVKDVEFIGDTDDGYIDHSSKLNEDDLENILQNWFEDFIFNGQSCVITGNDNDEDNDVSYDARAAFSIYKGN